MPSKKPKRQPLSIRLYQDEALQAIARLVGYSGKAYPMSEEETKKLYERFGKERIAAAADELLDYDTAAKVAKLKPDVRKNCFGLLGPAPEQEDWFYRNPDGTPTERPKKPTTVEVSPWEMARPIAAVKNEMRKVCRRKKAAPTGSVDRDKADDELNGLREELSYAADRLASARHADYGHSFRRSRHAESAQEYVVWKLRRERDALQEEYDVAEAGHGDEQVIEALRQRLERVTDELRFQAEEVLHEMVQ